MFYLQLTRINALSYIGNFTYNDIFLSDIYNLHNSLFDHISCIFQIYLSSNWSLCHVKRFCEGMAKSLFGMFRVLAHRIVPRTRYVLDCSNLELSGKWFQHSLSIWYTYLELFLNYRRHILDIRHPFRDIYHEDKQYNLLVLKMAVRI